MVNPQCRGVPVTRRAEIAKDRSLSALLTVVWGSWHTLKSSQGLQMNHGLSTYVQFLPFYYYKRKNIRG